MDLKIKIYIKLVLIVFALLVISVPIVSYASTEEQIYYTNEVDNTSPVDVSSPEYLNNYNNSTNTKSTTGTKQTTQPTSTNSKGSSTSRDPKNGFVICGNDVNNPCNVSHLFKITIMIINYMIGMAGFLAVAFIVYAGILMITSQGQGSLVDAKQRLTGAVIGLAIVATAFVLVNAAFTGSLNLGVKNGALIFTDPKAYINTNN